VQSTTLPSFRWTARDENIEVSGAATPRFHSGPDSSTRPMR
jgi:hypothetical protein